MNGKVFERCLVWTVCQKAAEMTPPKNDTDLAVEAFKGVNHPVNAWRSVRNGNGQGRFRSLSIEEAYNLALAVSTTIDKLCWDVSNHIRNGWTLENDISNEKGTPGRPKLKEKEQKELIEKGFPPLPEIQYGQSSVAHKN